MPLALTERQTQQTHEDGQIVTAARLDHQRLLDEDFQEFFERRLVFRLGLTTLKLFIETDADRPEESHDRRNQRGGGNRPGAGDPPVDRCVRAGAGLPG